MHSKKLTFIYCIIIVSAFQSLIFCEPQFDESILEQYKYPGIILEQDEKPLVLWMQINPRLTGITNRFDVFNVVWADGSCIIGHKIKDNVINYNEHKVSEKSVLNLASNLENCIDDEQRLYTNRFTPVEFPFWVIEINHDNRTMRYESAHNIFENMGLAVVDGYAIKKENVADCNLKNSAQWTNFRNEWECLLRHIKVFSETNEVMNSIR